MGRSGYDMPNFRSSNSDPNATPPRKAGMGLIVPNPSWPQQDPKGKGKERADASSGSAGGAHQTHHAHLPPVRRSADFREAVVEPFPELPQSQRHHRGFGLDVGPRTYTPVGAGGSGGSRARPRALELGGGSTNNPIDVDVGSTSSSSSAGFASSGDGMSDDDLKTPRASQFALPDHPPRTASRPSQHPLQPQHSQAYYQGNRQYDDLPAPRRVLPSQASQFGFTTNNNGSGGGGGNSHSKSQGSQHAINFNAPPLASSRHSAFTSDTSQPPQLYGSMSSGTGAYDFRSSSSSSSSGMTNARGMATPNPGQMGFPPGLGPMSTAATTPRAIPGPPPGFPPGFNTGPLNGSGSRPRLEARGFPFFPPQPPTQAEKDRRRKAALDAGFEQLLAKRQKRNH
ncbi:hypothetical protein QBC45DRAFT_423676 [Copromyces sp. CBS 386.78]|nr:hypothetical protein QBC45DRAFT_423676 [Copromyces sp. CBS 386.78]